MVRLYWITSKKTGHIIAFRFKENAEKKFELEYKNREDVDNFYIDEVDTPISELPPWSWFWSLDTPEKEYKNSILCEVED